MAIKNVYHFVDSNLGVQTTEKEEAVLEVVLPGRLANDLPWGKHCLPRGTKCRGKL